MKKEAAVALSCFPELQNVRIRFRIKKSFTPLKTKPDFISMFLPKKKRSYVITISNKTTTQLQPLIFKNIPEAGKIGVLGHEFSHVVDFSKKSSWQSLKVAIGHFSKKYMDSLEFHTDRICIEHGLGTNLQVWSSFVRNTMQIENWRGADFARRGDMHHERYMNPATIGKYLATHDNTAAVISTGNNR